MAIYLYKNKRKVIFFNDFEKTGIFSQFIGLMFRKTFFMPLLFQGNGRMAIHSFFCPIFEAIFIDKNKKIIKICFFSPRKAIVCPNAFFLLECPSGTVFKFKLKKGDELQWKDK